MVRPVDIQAKEASAKIDDASRVEVDAKSSIKAHPGLVRESLQQVYL